MLTPEPDTELGTVAPFAEQYLLVRMAEQRVYPDAIVRALPAIDSAHPHAHEWQQRARSAERLKKYLTRKPIGRVLEVGCGNGWLAHFIASHTGHHVIATDIQTHELEQAGRLFRKENLQFIHSDGSEKIGEEEPFTYIVFAASLQYFPSLANILDKSLDRLEAGGEIHIIDTRFYHSPAIPEARERTRRYYQALGYPGMMRNYFHHSLEELRRYHPDFLFNPSSLINRFTGAQHEFPWIRINKAKQPH